MEQLLANIRANDPDGVAAALGGGVDVNLRDPNGWTPLCWAAGAGHARIVRLLLERGADVFATGTDQRTPYLIALAAGHADAARMLGEAEQSHGGDAARGSSGLGAERPYCRAYALATLRQYPHWHERTTGGDAITADDVLFVHRDLTVSRSIWAGEDVVFDAVTEEWRGFCDRVLNFRPPDDLDLLTQMRAS